MDEGETEDESALKSRFWSSHFGAALAQNDANHGKNRMAGQLTPYFLVSSFNKILSRLYRDSYLYCVYFHTSHSYYYDDDDTTIKLYAFIRAATFYPVPLYVLSLV